MTMKQIAPFLLVAALSACGQAETPKQATNVPTVEKYLRNIFPFFFRGLVLFQESLVFVLFFFGVTINVVKFVKWYFF